MQKIDNTIFESKMLRINSDIFERKIRNVIQETGGVSNETKAAILLTIQDELEGRNEWGEN